MAVSGIEGGSDGIFSLLAVGRLVDAESDLRNLVAIIEFDCEATLRWLTAALSGDALSKRCTFEAGWSGTLPGRSTAGGVIALGAMVDESRLRLA